MKKIDNIINRYRHNLISTHSALESSEGSTFSKASLKKAIEAKTFSSGEEIKRLRNDSDVSVKNAQKLTEAINTEGKMALEAVHKNDKKYFKDNPFAVDLLEVIVKTDGSRPSFLVKNGTVDFSPEQAGLWNNLLVGGKYEIDHAIACVGRIDKAGQHIGTGFLIGQNIMVTNLHVLQSIASKTNNDWKILDDVSIDFGYEYQGIKTLNSRELKSVLFDCGNVIDGNVIDHSKIDMTIIELTPLTNSLEVPRLNYTNTIDQLMAGSFLYTIGYPGNPGLSGLSVYGQVLEELYKSTYGFKRLSPGEVIVNSSLPGEHTICHDASTLGGNSGSVIISTNKVTSASAIHYGGTLASPRENWGLLLGAILTVKNKKSAVILSDIFTSNGVFIE